MTSNQIVGYNCRFLFPRALYSRSLVRSWEMQELNGIYIFFHFWNGWSWLKRQNKYRMWIPALLVRLFDTVICWESQNLRESVIDRPRLIKLTVGEDITSYRCGISGADLFVCTKRYERLTLFEKANWEECTRYQGVICSIYQSIKDY